MKEIPLQNGMVALVDDEDYERVNGCNWYIDNRNSVLSGRNDKKMTLQRFILDFKEKGMRVSFKNKNFLDFRKSNLIAINFKDSMNHRRKGNRNSSSKYKGVFFEKRRKKWVARITHEGKTTYIGDFDNEWEAAHSYNLKAKELWGKQAYQNSKGKDNNASYVEISERKQGRHRKNTKSEFKGVRSYENKEGLKVFQVRFQFEKRRFSLGCYRTEIEAAKAYDKKAFELYGDKAILNFPQEVTQ